MIHDGYDEDVHLAPVVPAVVERLRVDVALVQQRPCLPQTVNRVLVGNFGVVAALGTDVDVGGALGRQKRRHRTRAAISTPVLVNETAKLM